MRGWSLGTVLLVVAGSAGAAEPSPLPITAETLSAVLSSDAFGYDVTCVINGHDVGIRGET